MDLYVVIRLPPQKRYLQREEPSNCPMVTWEIDLEEALFSLAGVVALGAKEDEANGFWNIKIE